MVSNLIRRIRYLPYLVINNMAFHWSGLWDRSFSTLFGKDYLIKLPFEHRLRKMRQIFWYLYGARTVGYAYYGEHVSRRIIQTRVPDGTLLVPEVEGAIVIGEVYGRQVNERYYRIQADDVIVAVGAYVGITTLKFAKEGRVVIAIEPHPSNYRLLVQNIQLNKLENAIPLNMALGSGEGTAKLYLRKGDSYSHTIQRDLVGDRQNKEYVKIRIGTLDRVLEDLNIRKVDFIQMDVEGSAYEVLEGARNTVKNNDVSIAVGCEHGSKELLGVYGFLSNMGLDLKVHWEDVGAYVYAHKKSRKATLL